MPRIQDYRGAEGTLNRRELPEICPSSAHLTTAYEQCDVLFMGIPFVAGFVLERKDPQIVGYSGHGRAGRE